MFKKGLAILLSVVLLLTQFISLCVTATNSEPTEWTQDFESYDGSGNRLVAYTLYTSNGTDGNTHSGTKSIYRAAANSTYGVAVFPTATTATIVAEKEYELRFWIKIASAVPGTSTIQLMYSGDKSNANAQVSGSSKPNISVLKTSGSTNVDTTKVGEWQEIVYQFTATHTGHLTITGWGTSEYYLDDITLKELKQTTISFNTNGGSTVDAVSGKSGSAITLPANPTKTGYTFAGWYTDSTLTTKFTATTFPTSDITLYAKWSKEGVLEQDFESYDASGNKLVAYTLYTSNGTDGNAHSGTKSIYRAAANSTYGVAVFPTATTTTLVEGKGYELRLWIKIASAVPGTSTIQLMYSNDKSNANAQVSGSSKPNISVLKTSGSTNVDTSKVGEWQEIVYQFTATHTGHLVISGWGTSEYYLDDITLTAIPQSTITFNTNGGSTVESITGGVGAQITMPTAPTKTDYLFDGWYTDSALTTKFTATTYPESDITLYAKWKLEGYYEQDFESYEATGNRLVNYTLYTSNGTDGNAHSGTKSIYRKADNLTYRIAVLPDEATAPIEAGNEYQLKMWVKLASEVTDTGTIQLMYCADKNNANAQVADSASPNICVLKPSGSTNIDTTKVGEWQEVVYTFTAECDAYLNFTGWGESEYYLDDITLKRTSVSNMKISFETNGGNAVADIKGVAGAEITSLPVPTREGMAFNGWYTDAELTDAFYSTVFPESNITLYAAWIDEDKYSQNFEGYMISGTIATNTLSTYTKVSGEDKLVHAGKRSLHKPAVNSSYFVSPFPYATKKLEEGKGYKLNMWVYLPNKIEKGNEGAWSITYLDSQKNAFSNGDRPKTNIKYFNSSFTAGEWQEIELIFIAGADGYAGLYAYGAFEMYIDDITLVEVDTVTVSFDTCGGNPLEALKGAKGQIVANVPTPTHPDEKSFAGWFTDKEYTDRFSFKTFPETDIKVYAKWIKKGSFEQTFEGYYYENGGSNTSYSKEAFSVYHATSADDEYVHSGKSSMRYYQKLSGVTKTYAFSIFDPTMGELELGEKYYVSYWMKFKEISNTVYHAVYNNSVVDNPFANYAMKGYTTVHKDIIGKTGDVSQYFYGPAGKIKVSEPDENGWVKFTFEATANDKYFSIYMDWDAEVYIDDVTIEPLPAGVVNSNYDKPYCEPLYDEINYQQPKALNKKSSTPKVYPLELTARGDYVFSASLSKNAKDGYIALAWDADGKNIINGTKVTAGKSCVLRLILDKSDTIYLVVYNPIGKGMVERAILCRTLSAKDSLNKQENKYQYYEDSQLPELSDLLKGDEFAEVFRDAMFETDFIKSPVSDSLDGGASSDTEADLPESEQVLPDEDNNLVEFEENLPETEETSPQTSDMFPIVSVIAISVIALGTIIVCSIKKRRGLVCND